MTRLITLCLAAGVLSASLSAASASPMSGQPDVVEARASGAANKSATASRVKCRYVNGVLICNF